MAIIRPQNMAFYAIMLALLAGCSSKIVSTTPDMMSSAEYRNRPTLANSLFQGATPLTDQQITKILGSKLVMPHNARLVIIRLRARQTTVDSWGRGMYSVPGSKSFAVDEEIIKGFIAVLKNSKMFSDVSVLPNFLVGDEASFESFRTVGLRAQADLIFVTRPESYIDWKVNFTRPNEAKAYSTVETILIDSRTGAIPFTSISSGENVEKKSDEDYSIDETMIRSKQLAEGNALKNTADELVKFLKALK